MPIGVECTRRTTDAPRGMRCRVLTIDPCSGSNRIKFPNARGFDFMMGTAPYQVSIWLIRATLYRVLLQIDDAPASKPMKSDLALSVFRHIEETIVTDLVSDNYIFPQKWLTLDCAVVVMTPGSWGTREEAEDFPICYLFWRAVRRPSRSRLSSNLPWRDAPHPSRWRDAEPTLPPLPG